LIKGLDSVPPTDAQIASARAAGYGVWAGYLPGLFIDPAHFWSKSDFDRVRSAGLGTFAYVSGQEDPANMKSQGAANGVQICLDVEGGIRPDGPWVQSWLDISGAGLYGNAPVFNGRSARFSVLANYPGFDPRATWPSTLQHPNGPTGWQWQGTHNEFGISVDSTWFDDSLASLFGSTIAGELSHDDLLRLAVLEWRQLYFFTGDKTQVPTDLVLADGTHVDLTGPVISTVQITLPELKQELDAIMNKLNTLTLKSA
jgi:hypothetical protein